MDRFYMTKAIQLALLGCGRTNPNPMVGAVIVKNQKIIGYGYHEKYGELHAERNALANCTENPEGATIYVTLEPCCHYGKTPPCTDAIIENKLSKVVIGSRDPNPVVSGKGVGILRRAGINVVSDFMRDECDDINPVFFHYISCGLPYVVMKYAMTMDGKIASYTGDSKWITGEKARENVHKCRNRYTAIMTGIGTVLADDPLLTCRIDGGRNPIRIIADTHLRTPLESRIVTTTDQADTVIATACQDRELQKSYVEKGCSILELDIKDGHINLNSLMKKLGEMKIDSVFLEGGSSLNYSALKSGIVSKVHAYIAPKILGGMSAKSPVGGKGISSPEKAFRLHNQKTTFFDEDILIESEVRPCSRE